MDAFNPGCEGRAHILLIRLPKILDLTAPFFTLLPKLVIKMFKGTICEPSLEWRICNIARHFVFLFIGLKACHPEASFHERRRITRLQFMQRASDSSCQMMRVCSQPAFSIPVADAEDHYVTIFGRTFRFICPDHVAPVLKVRVAKEDNQVRAFGG